MNRWRQLLSMSLLSTALIGSAALAQPAAPATQTSPAAARVAQTDWQSKEVGVGVTWKYHHFDSLFDSPQSVSVLEVDLNQPGVRLDIAAAPKRMATSALAEPTEAVAAVNGGYFNMKAGVAHGLLIVDGQPYQSTGGMSWPAFGITPEGDVVIQTPPGGEWKGWPGMTEAMGTGPMLVVDGQVQIGPGWGKSHTDNRHPRTALGLTGDNRAILITVDGRHEQAKGMSLTELAQVMVGLGCQQAINLDGGGSTTMWVRGEGTNGVVNYPSDNKKFDHQGQRTVTNAVLVIAPDILIVDTGEGDFLPADRWQRSSEGSGFIGEDYAVARSSIGARAVFKLRVDDPGVYQVAARAPQRASDQQGLPRAKFRVGRTTSAQSIPLAPGQWTPLTTVEVSEPGEVEVTLFGERDQPLAVDAVRLQQVQ